VNGIEQHGDGIVEGMVGPALRTRRTIILLYLQLRVVKVITSYYKICYVVTQ